MSFNMYDAFQSTEITQEYLLLILKNPVNPV